MTEQERRSAVRLCAETWVRNMMGHPILMTSAQLSFEDLERLIIGMEGFVNVALSISDLSSPTCVGARIRRSPLKGDDAEVSSELEGLQARYDTLFTLAEKVIDTERRAGQPYSDARLVRGDYIKELRQFIRGAK